MEVLKNTLFEMFGVIGIIAIIVALIWGILWSILKFRLVIHRTYMIFKYIGTNGNLRKGKLLLNKNGQVVVCSMFPQMEPEEIMEICKKTIDNCTAMIDIHKKLDREN